MVWTIAFAACSSSSGGGPAASIAGVELPASVVPAGVDFPTAFPRRIGERMVASELYELEKSQPGVRLFYEGSAGPDVRTITGYTVRFKSDPVPDLARRWGASTSNDPRADGVSIETESNHCWAAPERKVQACVVKLRSKTFHDLEYTALP